MEAHTRTRPTMPRHPEYVDAVARGGPPWAALTGTPGVGKSTVAGLLASRWYVVELGRGERGRSAARDIPRRSRQIDVGMVGRVIRRSSRAARSHRALAGSVLVGHLAHLLPVRDVVVLRCHPRELARRLRDRRVARRDVTENQLSEVLDTILVEAVQRRTHGRIWEVDTTGRSPSALAHTVDRLLRRRPASRFGQVDWLADPWVTEELLRNAL